MCIFTSFHPGGGGVVLIGLGFLLVPWLLGLLLRNRTIRDGGLEERSRGRNARDFERPEPECPYCGQRNPLRANYCGGCGGWLRP